MQVSRLLSSSFRHLSSVSPFHFTRQTHQTWKVPDASQIAYLVRAQPYLSVCIFIQSILVSGSSYFFPLQPPSFPPTPFSPVTKLAVSLSICWFFLQWPCTCSHLLSCWPPLPPSPLLNPPPPPLLLSLHLPPSLLNVMLPGALLAQLASLSFNPSVGKSTLFTAGGPGLFSSSRSAKAPPSTPRSVVSKARLEKRQLFKNGKWCVLTCQCRHAKV